MVKETSVASAMTMEELDSVVDARGPGMRRRATRYMLNNPLIVLGLTLVLLWIVIAIFAPLLAPYSPLQQDILHRQEGPGASHLFGTDDLGRDVFSRVLYGAQI